MTSQLHPFIWKGPGKNQWCVL